MSLTRFYYDPFFSLSEFNSLFDDAFASRSGQQNQVARQTSDDRAFRPKMDLHESPESNLVTATFELPGLKKENVNIDIHSNRLTISGEREQVSDKKEEGYVVKERSYGKFSRSLPLPTGTKPGDVKATMNEGILTVTFPKANPEAAPKKIAIN